MLRGYRVSGNAGVDNATSVFGALAINIDVDDINRLGPVGWYESNYTIGRHSDRL